MKQKICRAFLFFLFTFNVMAQDKWVLASTPFSFSKHYEKNTVSESLESAIPKLILEQFAENLTRTSFQDELIGRQLFSHRQKRLDLFLQLSGEVKNRDALFLKNYSQKELNKKLKECEKKIDSLKKQIDENLLEDEVLVQKKNSIENANLENANMASEKSKGANVADEKNYVLEDVKLYKDSFTELFVSSADKNNLHAFEKSVVSNGINALLTGTISSYDGYISVATSLTVYPGAKVVGSATDVDSISNVHRLASRLSSALSPHVSNSVPVVLIFDIEPKSAKTNMTFSLDDVVYKESPTKVVVPQGVHSLSFSSPEFSTIGTTYSFHGSKSFLISVKMQKKSETSIFMSQKKFTPGMFYMQESNGVEVTNENNVAKLFINNKEVLGLFISADGFYSPFYIDQKLMTENASLVASLKNFDKDLYINQRRKRMYGAYSALVISLMGTFFTMGNRNSLLPGDASFNAWNVATYSFIGTSAACGTWFIYELVRYLMAADSTLPSKAKKLKEDLSFRYIENNITNIENNVTDNEENIIDVTE